MDLMEKIVSLCKRRGFVFPNSEIYGGIQGFFDYGPLGVEMKNNIKKIWWNWYTRDHENVVGIDGAIITHPRVWEASGHVEAFTDPLIECKICHARVRADQEDAIAEHEKKHDSKGDWTEPRKFNLLVETSLGVVEGEKKTTYLRGEACQDIYLDYQNVLDSRRLKIPFGIVQIGKAFRNEITPRQFLFRQREFEQWDLQWFTKPEEMEKWYEYWKNERMKWYQSLINHKDKLRFRQHDKEELAHYAKIAFDIEYDSPFGWKEWEGIHWRGDWDLRRHGEYSGKDFTYTDQETGEKFLPQIVETSGGLDRTFLFLLIDAYNEEQTNGQTRVVLKLRPDIAPYKLAVFPLVSNKKEIVDKAREIYLSIKPNFATIFDNRGNIGKRYFSQDEIGTPWCLTVDYQTLEDNTVTLRERDTTDQERIPIPKVESFISNKLTTST